MKTRIAFLALIVLLTLTSCGDDFDAQAEEEAVVAVAVGMENADTEAILASLHEDLTGFTSFPYIYQSLTYQDIAAWVRGEHEAGRWDDYEVLVSPELSVVTGSRTYEEANETEFVTDVYKKEDGQWKLIHTHVSYAGP